MKTTNTECPFGLNSYHFLIVNLFTYNDESNKCMKEIVWNKMFAKICPKWRNISFERLISFAWNNYLGQLAECICQGGNYLKGNYTESNYPLDNYPGAICPGNNFSRGDRFGGEWWGRLSRRQVPREAIVRRAIFLPGGPLSVKQLFRGQLSCNQYICFIALHCTFFY